MPCEYFLLIERQRQPCLLAIDDGLSLAGQHASRDSLPSMADSKSVIGAHSCLEVR